MLSRNVSITATQANGQDGPVIAECAYLTPRRLSFLWS